MKKFRGYLIFLCLLLLTMTGCSSNSKNNTNLDPENPVAITLWHYYTGDNKVYLENMVNEFNHTVGADQGVLVSINSKGGIAELEEALTNSAKGLINAEEMPNIFSCYLDKLIEIDSYEEVADLNQYFTEDEVDLYISDFITDGIAKDGRLLSIPIAKSTEILYINQTDFQPFINETGFNINDLASWEGIYDASRYYYKWSDAKTPDVSWDGKSFIGIDSLANFIVISNQQLGTEIFDAENNIVKINKDSMRRIFDIYYQGMCLEYFNSVRAFSSDDVKAGDLLAYVGSTSSASYFPRAIEVDNSEVSIELNAMLYPVFENSEILAIQQGAGMSISKSDPAKEEGSVLFLKWLTSPEKNIPFSIGTGYLPVEKEAYESELLNESLEYLKNNNQMSKNIFDVYELATTQIMELGTYSPTPFEGSYDARNILASTLGSIAQNGKENVREFKEEGYSEDEIIEELDVDNAFETWIANIETEFTEQNIEYIIEDN